MYAGSANGLPNYDYKPYGLGDFREVVSCQSPVLTSFFAVS